MLAIHLQRDLSTAGFNPNKQTQARVAVSCCVLCWPAAAAAACTPQRECLPTAASS